MSDADPGIQPVAVPPAGWIRVLPCRWEGMLDTSPPPARSAPGSPLGFVRFLRTSATYVVGPALGRALGIVLVPFLVTALGPDDFGRFEVLSTTASAVASILLIGMDLSSISLFHRREDADRAAVFPSAMAVGAVIAVVLLVVAIVFRRPLATALVDDVTLTLAVVLVGAYAAVTIVGLVARAALRAEDRARAHSGIVAGASVATSALVALVLLGDRIGIGTPSVTRIMAAHVLAAIGGSLVAVAVARRRVIGAPDRATATAIVTLGAPQVAAMAALWGSEVVHRLIVLEAAGPAAVGAIGIGARVASALSFVVLGVGAAWHPRAFAQLRTPDGGSRVALDARRVAALLCLAAVGLATIGGLVSDLLGGDEFVGVPTVTGFLVVMVAGTGVLQIATLYTVTHQRFADAGLAQVVGVAVGLIVTAVLVGRSDAWGGAVAGSIGLATAPWFAVAVASVLGHRRGHLPLAPLSTFGPAAIAMPACVLVARNPTGSLGVLAAVAAIAVSGWALLPSRAHPI